MIFPIFPSLVLSSFQLFKQPKKPQIFPTVPTGPTGQGSLIWTARNKFEPLKLIHTNKCISSYQIKD
jgi:hypothetical protein